MINMIHKAQDYIKHNLKKYRLAKKLTQEKLSELCGVSCDYISEIERGKRCPSMKRLDMIAETLDVDSYLFLKP